LLFSRMAPSVFSGLIQDCAEQPLDEVELP